MRFTSPVCTTNDTIGLPCKAEFFIEPETKQLILHLAQLVKDNKLYKVEKFDYRVTWLYSNGPEQPTACDTLCVTATDFWFSAYTKYDAIEMCTAEFSISSLENVELEGD